MSRDLDSLIEEAEGMNHHTRQRPQANVRKPNGGRRGSNRYSSQIPVPPTQGKTKPVQQPVQKTEPPEEKFQEEAVQAEQLRAAPTEPIQEDPIAEEKVAEKQRQPKQSIRLDFHSQFAKPYCEAWSAIGMSFLNIFDPKLQAKRSRAFAGWEFLFNEDRTKYEQRFQIVSFMKHLSTFFGDKVQYTSAVESDPSIHVDALSFDFDGEQVLFMIESIPEKKVAILKIQATEYPELNAAYNAYLAPMGHSDITVSKFVHLMAATANLVDQNEKAAMS